jgi:tetratricopeptide (TPR) repeat protein
MNNMVYLLSPSIARSRGLHEEEDMLNDTPFFAIPEVFPRKAFFGRLGEIPPPSRALFLDAPPFEEAGPAPSEFDAGKMMRTIERHLDEDQLPPADQAQNLYYDAIEMRSEAEECILLKKALQIDPENVDAMRAMLAHRRLSPQEELKELRRILAVAERRLGPTIFQECKGVFWGHMETRPYMRTRAQMAERLQSLGQSDEAIEEWQGMLELNPNDNQGVRYPLLAELLARNQLAPAAKIFAKYNECKFSTLFAWCRVLERFLCDDRAGAEQAMTAARKQNGYSEAYIKGHKHLPPSTPEAYSIGSREEAICFAEMLHNSWSKDPVALKWLSAQPRNRQFFPDTIASQGFRGL